MKDYQSFDDAGTLFVRWDFANWDDTKLQVRIASFIKNVKASLNIK